MKQIDEELIEYARNGDLQKVQLLLDKGADIHANDDEALRWASSNGHLEVVRLLLSNGANIHSYNDFALRYASYHGYLEIVKLLLANGAEVHAFNDYSLRQASENGHLEVVRLLYIHAKTINSPMSSNLFEYYEKILPKNTKLNRTLYPDYQEFGEYLIWLNYNLTLANTIESTE